MKQVDASVLLKGYSMKGKENHEGHLSQPLQTCQAGRGVRASEDILYPGGKHEI